jgi:hypothetical protein
MIALLRSLRSLVFGETWTIPLGVVTAIVISVALRSALSVHTWGECGGFALAALVAATLALALRASR